MPYYPPPTTGGSVGPGTIGTVPKFATTTTLADSLVSESGAIVTVAARFKSGNDQATVSAFESGGGAIGNKIFNTPTSASVAFCNFLSQVRVDTTSVAQSALVDAGRQRVAALAGANNITAALRAGTFEIEVNGMTGTMLDGYAGYFAVNNATAASAGTLYGPIADITSSGATGAIACFTAMPSCTGGTTPLEVGFQSLAPTGAGAVTTHAAFRMWAPGGTPNTFYTEFAPGVNVHNQRIVWPIDIPATGDTLKATVAGTAPYVVTLDWSAPGGSGTVTSAALASITGLATASGTPITTTGTFTLTLDTQTANKVFASATSGGSATPAFRALVAADIPSLPASQITSGVFAIGRLATGTPDGTKFVRDDGTLVTPGGSGTVTSAAMTVPSFLSVSGTPITTTGTFAVTLANANANEHFLGPASGAAAAPTFRLQTNADKPDFHKYVEYFEDYIGGLTTTSMFQTSVSGTGAAFSPGSLADDGGHPGLAQMATGTTTTGKSACWTNANAFALGSGAAYYDALGKITTLSDGTETYVLRVGFIDSVTAESTDGCFFRYTHSVNAGKWEAVTRSNNVETASATDTGVTAQTTNYSKFRVEVNAAGTSVAFYIDGTLVATNTANIPTGASRTVGAGKFVLKSAGSTSRTFAWDYQYIRLDLTTAR